MAVAYNNIKVPTDGLVLYYDMHNPKSWRGKPTENLFTNPSFSSGDLTGWGLGNNHGTYHETTIDPSSYRRDGYSAKVSVVALGGSSSGHHYAMNRTLSTTNNSTVSVSAYIKGRPGTISLLRVTRIVDGAYQWSGGVSGDVNGNMTSTGEWQKLTTTLSEWTGAGTTSGIHVRIGFNVNVELTVGDFCNIDECQFEFGEYPTPFVTGERTTTQVVLDLTKTNTIPATSLTYSSNNDFTFNGSTDYIDLSSSYVQSMFNNTVGNNFTLMCWARPKNIGTHQALISKRHGDSMSFFLLDNGKVTLEMDDTSTRIGTNTTLQNNNWYHIAVTFVNNTTDSYCRYYVNGVFERQDSNKWDGNGIDSGSYGLWVGWQSRDNYSINPTYFNGEIPQVWVYSRDLSDQEVASSFLSSHHRYVI